MALNLSVFSNTNTCGNVMRITSKTLSPIYAVLMNYSPPAAAIPNSKYDYEIRQLLENLNQYKECFQRNFSAKTNPKQTHLQPNKI